MKHKITVLALSRKWGGRCVAGYDHNDRRIVRLVSDEFGKELEAGLTTGIELLDIIEAEVVCRCPYEHQTENILIDSSCGLIDTGSSDAIEEFNCLLTRSEDVFGDSYYKIDDTSGLNHSFELVRFQDMTIYVEDGKTKADFSVGGKRHKWYRITDIIHEGRPAHIGDGYAVITIPPSDDFTSRSGYYKYIAAIYPMNM